MNSGFPVKYHSGARALHWIIAVAVIVQLVLGLGYEAWRDVFPAMPLHKALGFTILLFSIFRLYWRLTHAVPPPPANVAGWQRMAARGMHWLFYFLLIALPISGWIFTSAGTSPSEWFGLFDIPKLPVVKDSLLADTAHEAHEIMGLLLIPLFVLHAGAAFYHHLVVRDDVLRRML